MIALQPQPSSANTSHLDSQPRPKDPTAVSSSSSNQPAVLFGSQRIIKSDQLLPSHLVPSQQENKKKTKKNKKKQKQKQKKREKGSC